MSTAQLRIQELTKRVYSKTWLQDLINSDGWIELLKIINEHIEKHNRRSNNRTLNDDKRIKALEAKRAIEDLLVDIHRRIDCGKSAAKTLQDEAVELK